MKLEDIIPYWIDPNKLDQLYEDQNLKRNSDAVLVYMKGNLSLDAELSFFDIEETDDLVEYEKDGVKYVALFPVDFGAELAEMLRLKEKSRIEAAKELLNYRINDA